MCISKRFYISAMTIVLVVVFMFSSAFVVYAADEESLEIASPAAILMDSQTGKILYEKNSHEVRSCASITKVMTMILVMEALDSGKIKLTDTVSASEHAASMGGSDIWLKAGETMTVDEMIKAVVVASANDAAVALAEYISGSEDLFVSQMNEKAQGLFMGDTVFKNCNGLDEDGHVTSANDVAIMSRELIKHPKIFEYTSIWMDYLRDGKTQLVNTNKLLKSYNGITGLKTGTTDAAGCCISATAKRGNLSLIAVVLGGKTGKERFKDASTLLDFGFANYNMMEPTVSEDIFEPIKVLNGMKQYVNIKAEVDGNILIKKGKEHSVEHMIELVSQITAPVHVGQIVGHLIYKINDETVAEYDVIATEDVGEINFLSSLKELFRNIFCV